MGGVERPESGFTALSALPWSSAVATRRVLRDRPDLTTPGAESGGPITGLHDGVEHARMTRHHVGSQKLRQTEVTSRPCPCSHDRSVTSGALISGLVAGRRCVEGP